jgi:hypothetical protein
MYLLKPTAKKIKAKRQEYNNSGECRQALDKQCKLLRQDTPHTTGDHI